MPMKWRPSKLMMQPRRPNVRAWLSFLFGVVAVGVIPAAIELTRKIPGAVLLDAWLHDVVRRGVFKIPGLPLEMEDVPSAPVQVQPPERLSELLM